MDQFLFQKSVKQPQKIQSLMTQMAILRIKKCEVCY